MTVSGETQMYKNAKFVIIKMAARFIMFANPILMNYQIHYKNTILTNKEYFTSQFHAKIPLDLNLLKLVSTL